MKNVTLNKISDLFWIVSPNLFFLSVILSLITGLAYSLLIPFVMYAVSSGTEIEKSLFLYDYSFFHSPTSKMAVIFLVVCAAIIVMRTISMTTSMYLASKASSMHRLSIYRKIQKLSILQLEKIGHSNLINLIHIDVPHTTNAAMNIPVIWSAFITIIGTLSYLIYLDIRVFVFVFSALIFSIVTYQLPSYFASLYFQTYRAGYDKVQKGFTGLVNGAKELKLNDKMAKAYYSQELEIPENQILKTHVKGNFLFVLGENYGTMISFLVISIVIFLFPYIYDLKASEQFGIVMALLYLTGPVGLILSAMGALRQGKVSLKNIQKYYPFLTSEERETKTGAVSEWSVFKVSNVGFNYASENSDFSIDGVSFEMTKGEVVFITGGNGSGKSTLSKCLSLHYFPTEGQIYFDDQLLSYENLNDARQLISSIYSDFHLFEKLYDDNLLMNDEGIKKYLHLLGLENKISITDGVFNTTKLSSGQRKRLALLVLLLEDRPICIFDEWAADQDPKFKEIFYYDILNYLKKKNKLVIVISHDDRYFSCADRMLVMEDGKLKSYT